MASPEQLREAIADRILAHLEQGATSDTVLKLAEAWAWVSAPDQPHGGGSAA